MFRKAKKFVVLSAPALIFLLLLAGCGTESGIGQGAGTPVAPAATAETGAGMQEIKIVAKDNKFEPATYTAEAGKPLRITAINEGQNIHEVEVKGLMPETKLTAGQSRNVEVAAPAAGTYRIYCEIHGDQGMEGELVIK